MTSKKMFIFDNLMQLDDRGFQRLVRDVAQENALTAQGVDEVLVSFFTCREAAEILREDMEASGPVRWRMSAAQKSC